MFPQMPQNNRQMAPYNPDAPFQVIQIIAFSMIFGVLAFAAFAVYSVLGQQAPPLDSLLPQVVLGMSVMAVVARFVVPPIVARTKLREIRSVPRDDERQLQ